MALRRSRIIRALLASLLAAALLAPVPATADPKLDAVTALDLTPEQMVRAFDQARLLNLHNPDTPPPPITGDAELDAHIRSLGEARGYERRLEPLGPLVVADGRWLQQDAALAWEQLQAAAAAAGHSISLTSAYRSADHQRTIWLDRMTGTSDEALDTLMHTVAVPGYSKHHTGYAIDLRSGSAVLHDFALTAAYEWLSADNFANAIAYGWLPSYPAGVDNLGPNPEPWEFVWVGLDNMLCVDFVPTAERPFCDTVGSGFADDIVWLHGAELTTGCDAIRYCTDDLVTRGQAATFLWRLFGEEAPTVDAGFDDVPPGAYYTDPVRWMVQNEITTGTGPDLFSPSGSLTRAQFVTFLWRAAGHPAPLEPLPFADVDPDGYAATAIAWAASVGVTNGTSSTTFAPDATATRAQTAAFLHRFVDLVPI